MKVLIVASVDFHIASFHLPFINLLISNGHTVNIATKSTDNLMSFPGVDKQFDVQFERLPFKRTNIKAYQQLKKIINDNQYDIVHCHTPVAAMLTRFAARKARKGGLKVFYTAHGFHFYRGAPLLNWLFYYPVERMLAHYTDVLITINKEDYKRAKKFVAKRIEYIPGVGVDIQRFENAVVECAIKRKEIGVPEDATLLFSVGELNKNKNHEIIIRAVAKLQNENVHYLIAGIGVLEDYLRGLSVNLGVSKQVHFLGYRKDIPELYKTVDIFCFPSKREGLPVSLLEAMASELPCVASNIRGNIDLITDQVSGFLLNSLNEDDYVECLKKLITDRTIRVDVGKQCRERIKTYDIGIVLKYMQELYCFNKTESEITK